LLAIALSLTSPEERHRLDMKLATFNVNGVNGRPETTGDDDRC
jgi:hypothetical protein